MNRFRCGDVIPGCSTELVGTEGEILAGLTEHVRAEHELPELPPELVEAVRTKMEPV
jgi:predicted small metal-binding protein